MSSPTSTAATSRRPDASSTARQTSAPIRPFAPRTPTAIGSSGNGRGEGLLRAVVERADRRQGEWRVEDARSHRTDVVEADVLDALQDLVDTEELALHEL